MTVLILVVKPMTCMKSILNHSYSQEPRKFLFKMLEENPKNIFKGNPTPSGTD